MEKPVKLPINYNGNSRTDTIAELTKKQDGLCAICVGNFNYKRKRVVDHWHKTGDIRGLLCYSCNTGLGLFKDDPDLLERAIWYLLNFQKEIEAKKNWWYGLPDIIHLDNEETVWKNEQYPDKNDFDKRLQFIKKYIKRDNIHTFKQNKDWVIRYKSTKTLDKL